MTIDELQKNLEAWRKNKKSARERIPQEYWDEATKLAASHSISHISSKLGLNPNDIKRRMMPLSPTKKVIFQELHATPLREELKIILELTTPTGLTIKVYQ